jgi:hypothetical protein
MAAQTSLSTPRANPKAASQPCAAPRCGAPCALLASATRRQLMSAPDMLRKQLTIIGSWTSSWQGQADCARFVVDHDVEETQRCSAKSRTPRRSPSAATDRSTFLTLAQGRPVQRRTSARARPDGQCGLAGRRPLDGAISTARCVARSARRPRCEIHRAKGPKRGVRSRSPPLRTPGSGGVKESKALEMVRIRQPGESGIAAIAHLYRR